MKKRKSHKVGEINPPAVHLRWSKDPAQKELKELTEEVERGARIVNMLVDTRPTNGYKPTLERALRRGLPKLRDALQALITEMAQ